MSGSEDERFEKADAGSSLCEKIQSNRLKPDFIMKDCPCRISDATTAKPGKHGSAKVICKGKDILTGKVYECTFHAGDMIDAPIVNREEYTLLNIDDTVLELLGPNGEVKSDVNLPEEEHLKDISKKIRDIFEDGKKECLVTVLKTMGQEQVVDVREGAD